VARVKPVGQSFPPLEKIRANPVVGRNKEKLLTHLALDLSSSCIGWAVGSAKDRKLQRYGRFVFKTTAGVGSKLVALDEFLPALIDTFWPEVLLVEKPASRRGTTTLRHSEVLGIVRKVWAQRTGGADLEDAWLIPPSTIKKAMAVPPGENHDRNKIIMVNKINALYGTSFKFSKSKLDSDDDTADAVAVLTTYWRRNAA
jgi:Holliday junction resolvasome RuvABC endonuclease subunit